MYNKNFKYLGCETSYEHEKDSKKKASKICWNTGNSKQHFETNFYPEVFKNKSIQCTGSAHSFIWKWNLEPQTKG